MKTDFERTSLVFHLLATAGIILSLASLLESSSPLIQALCGGASSGCEEVRNSPYSTILGVPLGAWGVVSYVAWIILFRLSRAWAGMFGAFLLGAEFYFLYLQLYVIMALCVICMAQFAVVAMLNVLLFFRAYPADSARRWRMASLAIVLASFLLFYLPTKVEAEKTASSGVTSITSWGDPSSPVHLELFADYQCPYCARFEETMKNVMEWYPNVYIIFRDFIIKSHDLSPLAAVYANSVAYYEGKEAYLKTRFEIFENQGSMREYLEKHYKDMKKDEAMQKAVKAKILADHERAMFFGITGTPTTVISRNGKVIKKFSGNESFRKVKKELDAAIGGE